METRNVPTPSAGTAAFAPEPHRPAPHVPPRTLRARRRRPAVLAMAVALIAAGGLGGAALYTSSGQRIAVLALARDVPMGQIVTADDLVVAHIAGDPVLRPLDARDRTRTIGMRATTDLRRGALLLKADVTTAPVLQPDQQTVGLAAKRTQLPATRLQPGLQVLVVSTPDAKGDQAGAGRAPETIAAVVVTVGRVDTDGSQVVDVAVPSADGPRLAFWVSSGRFQVILAPRAGAAASAPAPEPSASGTAAGNGSTGSVPPPAGTPSGRATGSPKSGTGGGT
ncbi:SAF domain-containing protein [Streptomyces sp. NRRL B-24484]|uniref:SAF domain-containing protein n=1 Tax=Streptomyces sp. NRRL B-24484 TaxID=1463833 RepID=UPI0007C4E240|nr:SAF domain-containing protein [Streptomyces sp. NRRL B-24484]